MDPLPSASLRQRLTLVLAGVMMAVLVLTVAIAYTEVRYSARMAAGERLKSVAEQLAGLVEAGSEQRLGLVEELAAEPAVRSVLAGSPPTDTARLVEELSQLRTEPDSGLVVEVWNAHRRRVFSTGRSYGPGFAAEDTAGLAPVPTWGPFRRSDGQVLYWSAFPAVDNGRVQGWFVQQRRVGNATSAATIEELAGGKDTRVYLTYLGDSVWVSLSGQTQPAPKTPVVLDQPFTYTGAGSDRLAVLAPIAGFPWAVAVAMPMDVVAARPRTFLSRIAVVALVLILAAMALGSLLGRRLTGPIRELAAASDAMAAGDYGRRVRMERGDELGRLAAAFNAMADQVARSHEEQRSRADALEQANVEAEKARQAAMDASRAKSDFLATMSHEVRTPINAVLGYTELLQLGVPGPLTDTQRDYLKRIDRSSRLLIALVEDVLDFARMESGELRVEESSGSAAEAVGTAVAAVHPQAESKGVKLVASECPSDVCFRGDPQRVQQILLNLVSNAVKFTPEGGRVSVTCSRVEEGPRTGAAVGWTGEWLRTDVTDTGIGIAPEHLERMFEPFVQADSSYTRDFGGVGLGLSISRRLAAMMGGAVTAESEPGRGSRFTLWLRALDPAAESGPGAREKETSGSSRGGA